MTTEEVITEVENVFPLLDKSTLIHQGASALSLLQPILQRMSRVSCQTFTTPEEWTDKAMFRVCLYAILGHLHRFEVGDFQENEQCMFWLDPYTKTLVSGDSAKELMEGGKTVSTASNIMSVLVIVLLISMGVSLFMQNFMPVAK
jgi:hypothetical protein